MGNWTEAAPLVLRSVEHFRRAGDHQSVRGALVLAVGVLSALGEPDAAAVLYGTASVGHFRAGGGVPEYLASAEADLRACLGNKRFDEYVTRGRPINEDDAVELATQALTKVTTRPTPAPNHSDTD